MSVRFVTEDKIVSVGADGHSYLWNAASGSTLATLVSSPRELYCADISTVGVSNCVLGGQDGKIDIVDLSRNQISSTMQDALRESASNHIYSVRLHATDATLCASGGWDRIVRLWDIRSGTVTATLPGPFLCGDALDLDGHALLTASWIESSASALQLWDIRALAAPAQAVPLGTAHSAFLYAAQLAPGIIAAGGTHDLRVFRRSDRSPLGCFSLPSPATNPEAGHGASDEAHGVVQALHVSPCGSMVAAVGTSGCLSVVEIK
jgi:COMPASS component SWD3